MPGAYSDMEYGKFMSLRYLPHKQEDLGELLWREQQERERYKEGNPDAFIRKLGSTGAGREKHSGIWIRGDLG